MNRLRFVKVREVKSPARGNQGDAGIDFFVPTNLNMWEIQDKNIHDSSGFTMESDLEGKVKQISLKPHHRILIPSGIRLLIEPRESMLMAANKSGVATKKGLIFTAEIVDSPYVGEVHMGVYNTSDQAVTITAGEKLMQFIHVPVILTEPEEMGLEEFYSESQEWGTRGSGGFGSTGNK